MPKNPNGLLFLQKNKKPHLTLGLAVGEPGKWGRVTVSRRFGWDVYDFKKVIDKLVKKGLVVVKLNKLYPTPLGEQIYIETSEHPNYLED